MLESLLAWAPLALFAGVFIWFGIRQMNSYHAHVEEVKHINDELIVLTREMAAELREIKQILKDRN